MMQLVGYQSWQASGNEPTITSRHVADGTRLAYQDLCDGVLANTYQELSPGDRRFLVAMLPDAGSSRLTDVAARMGKGTNYASTYKNRLMAQGVIGDRPDGGFGFDLPYFKEYLQKKMDEWC